MLWLVAASFVLGAYLMSAALDRLTASVSAATSVAESAITLIGTIADEIRNNADDSDALNALADGLDAESTKLSAAVSANTPAAPPSTGGNTGTGDTTASDSSAPASPPAAPVE